MSLREKQVLVVGGGSGIGFAVAKAAMAEGAKVTIASTGRERLEAAAKRLGDSAHCVLDITDEVAVSKFFANEKIWDHIVTTAGDWGSARRGALAQIVIDEAKAFFEVRVWGTAILAKHGAPRIAAGGSLTLTSGMSAFQPQKGSVVATAMAGCVEHLMYGLAAECAPRRVNAVFPGGVATEVFQGLPEEMRKTEEARFEHQLIPRISDEMRLHDRAGNQGRRRRTTGLTLPPAGSNRSPANTLA